MTESLEDVIRFIQNEFVQTIGEPLSDYELKIIEKSIRLPFTKSFTTVAMITELIQSLISTVSELTYLQNRIKSLRYELNVSYRTSYEKNFTILTRSGRPSKLAIESELHYMSPELSKERDLLEKYDNLLEWITSQLELLNLSIRNCENLKYKL